ncbi:MAG: plastocyanin/azurin family copper-binding protein [Opitutales bacterium]|jgi:azurin
MKIFWQISFVLLLLVSPLWSGCGNDQNTPDAPAAPPAPAAIPVSDDSGTQVVQLTGNDTMQYNGARFTVTSGQPVRIELTNAGVQPRAIMAHNVVILQSGSDVPDFALAANQAKDNGYLPADQMNLVLAHTAFAGPGETVQTSFTAPAPGEYPFLCTFPGHFAAGMHGIMVVVPAK